MVSSFVFDAKLGHVSASLGRRQEPIVHYPLSREEHTAMVRYLASLRKQLQDTSELFSTRYGKASTLAEIAIKSLVCVTLLEHELLMAEPGEPAEPNESTSSVEAAVSA